MTKPTLEEYRAAVAQMVEETGDADMTKDGLPKLKALNKMLNDGGFDPLTAEERDDFHDTQDETDAALAALGLEPASQDTITITITKSMVNPVPVYVNGMGTFKYYVGKEVTVPRDVLTALEISDVQFDIKG